jgi:hypothetical protein
MKKTAEAQRLADDAARKADWKRWGPYLSERQWATVREDYSEWGNCWDYFPHDHARSRAYRWGEDGLLGITDRQCRICFAFALWNGRDSILKERLFGLTGSEGNHGEDVKEEYYYLDSTPTHSYMKALYKYPQAEFPYGWLVHENRQRGIGGREFELADTGVFNENRFFDVFAEYAKAAPDDILIRVTVHNRGPDSATIHVLPTIWFRNTWSWGCTHEGCTLKPRMEQQGEDALHLQHEKLGDFSFRYGPAPDGNLPPVLFTDNETNTQRLFNTPNRAAYTKDAFHEYVIAGNTEAVNPKKFGTKAAPHYTLNIPAGGQQVLTFRLTSGPSAALPATGPDVDAVFNRCQIEADRFYDPILHTGLDEASRNVARQGYAGLLWSKQFYHYVVKDWLDGDPNTMPPPDGHRHGRNAEWQHLYSRDIISMPDKWEYPWFAAWDLAFHMVPFARIDPPFAKDQLTLFLREWYMHPNGQIPAYEFAFGDVNPPVHAWAAWRVYKISGKRGERDRDFLEGVFQKLLINFTWWVNRKDRDGKNLFSGGFLGLDNIGVFDRSQPLPTGGYLQQADGTAWMAFYSLTMLAMALELAVEGDRVHTGYEDMASKFFEHFVQICDAMNALGGSGLWDEEDGFYYDQINHDGQSPQRLKVRSMVGLLPLIAVEVLDKDTIDRLPGFKKRFDWFINNRHDLAKHISMTSKDCCPGSHLWLLAIPNKDRLTRTLRYMLDESEFLSPHGLRALSQVHGRQPYVFRANGNEFRVDYVPGEGNTYLFGGNSNWRGPIWFPVNYLVIEALERYHKYYGKHLTIEYPTGSGRQMTMQEIADDLYRRLSGIFLPGDAGHRPCHGGDPRYAENPHWKDLVLFNEYFHGETGRGLGASHQTGWTALVLRCIENVHHREASARDVAVAIAPLRETANAS